MYKIGLKRFIGIFLSLIFVGVMVGTASAQTDVYLRADTMMLTLPDGLGGMTNVPMWGFAEETAFGNTTGTVSVPGPLIEVPPGETLLRIHVDNNLPDPISLQINGLMLINNSGPVWTELGSTAPAFTGSRPDDPITGNFTARVRSFSHETDPGNTTDVVYEFDVTGKSGTFMYMSATNPAKQVQMGLYGGVKIDVALGEAYPGVLYDKEVVLIYSEVDPLIHAAIDAGDYGPTGTITSSLQRDPKYFLINGMVYPDAGLEEVLFADPYDRVLVRFINAGYETHVPQLLNMYMTTVAEDGNLYAYPKEQYGAQLPAGKTMDAVIVQTTDGKFSIHDAAHHLTNAGAADPGGMLAYFDVACPGDLNRDGSVNFPDLAAMRANFFTNCSTLPPGTECVGDINNDGFVNFADLALMQANFFRSGCPQPAP